MIAQETRDEVCRIVGANLAKLRKAKGWSQTELGEKVGISYVSVSRIENGTQSPSTELLFAFADVFEVPTDELRKFPVSAS